MEWSVWGEYSRIPHRTVLLCHNGTDLSEVGLRGGTGGAGAPALACLITASRWWASGWAWASGAQWTSLDLVRGWAFSNDLLDSSFCAFPNGTFLGDQFFSHRHICYLEKEEMTKVSNEVVVHGFMTMEGKGREYDPS
jgi:hypothetical protein